MTKSDYLGGVAVEFVAIDFETANQQRSSACEVSLVKIHHGEIVEKYTSLIKPHSSMAFNPWNVRIHGLTEKDVSKAPEFSSVFHEIVEFTDGLPLIAHNASFDMSVLKHSAGLYHLELPEIEFYCTLALAKQSEALDLTSYSLSNVCYALEIEFNEIHRAENDALACSRVAGELLFLEKAADLKSLAAGLGVRPGLLNSNSFKSTGRVSRTKFPSALGKGAAKEFLNSLSEDDLSYDDDFVGREVIFTGALNSMKREEAQQMVLRAGGTTGNNITKKTSLVVVGSPYDNELRPGAVISGKLKKVLALRELGAHIELVNEIEFLELFEN